MGNGVQSSQPRVGVIDLGSNTVLLLVLEAGGRAVLERSRITRLGQGVFRSGRLDPAARDRTRSVVLEFAAEARAAGASPLVVVGTEALRRARDGRAFLAALEAEEAIDRARLLSGEEEAGFAIEATRRELGARAPGLVVVDVGGGSTELAWQGPEGAACGVSLPLGTVRLTEAHLRADPPSARELAPLRAAITRELAQLERAPRPPRGGPVVAVAGTATTLAALELALEPYDPERVEGLWLDGDRLHGWCERLTRLPVAARRELPGMEPGRADVIVAGLMILEGALLSLGVHAFRVSGRGVRHGVALRLLEGDRPVW